MVRPKCLLFEETLARVLRACKKNVLFYWRNRCSTGRSCSKTDQRLTRVFLPFVKERFFKAGPRVRFSFEASKFPLSRASMVSPPSKLKMFTGSVFVLLTSVSLKLIKIKIKLIYATMSS